MPVHFFTCVPRQATCRRHTLRLASLSDDDDAIADDQEVLDISETLEDGMQAIMMDR